MPLSLCTSSAGDMMGGQHPLDFPLLAEIQFSLPCWEKEKRTIFRQALSLEDQKHPNYPLIFGPSVVGNSISPSTSNSSKEFCSTIESLNFSLLILPSKNLEVRQATGGTDCSDYCNVRILSTNRFLIWYSLENVVGVECGYYFEIYQWSLLRTSTIAYHPLSVFKPQIDHFYRVWFH